MVIRFILLLSLLAMVLYFVVYQILNAFSNGQRHIKKAVSNADAAQREIWSSAQNVRDLISLYTKMALKHGPDSEEAKAFRFGVENKELSSDKKSLQAFNEIADIIERSIKNRK